MTLYPEITYPIPISRALMNCLRSAPTFAASLRLLDRFQWKITRCRRASSASARDHWTRVKAVARSQRTCHRRAPAAIRQRSIVQHLPDIASRCEPCGGPAHALLGRAAAVDRAPPSPTLLSSAFLGTRVAAAVVPKGTALLSADSLQALARDERDWLPVGDRALRNNCGRRKYGDEYDGCPTHCRF
jgi:hypothetical protein